MKFSTLLPLVALAVASRSLGVAADEEVEEEVAVAGPDYCSADPDLSCFLGGVPFCCGFDASLCPEEIPSCEVQSECADIQAAFSDCVGTRLGAGDPICDSWAREGEWFISDNWDALKGDTCFESWTNTCVAGAVGVDGLFAGALEARRTRPSLARSLYPPLFSHSRAKASPRCARRLQKRKMPRASRARCGTRCVAGMAFFALVPYSPPLALTRIFRCSYPLSSGAAKDGQD